YAARSREQLEDALRKLATGAEPTTPDEDIEFQPHANVDEWEIDIYARNGWPREYRAVREFVEFLSELPGPFLPPPRDLTGQALDGFIKEFHPLLWELKLATLLGMGGAGAPAYQKWLDVWREPAAEKYIVANGDESEPGTFKDREIMLRLPHLLVEGV